MKRITSGRRIDAGTLVREWYMDLWYLKPGHKIRTRDGAEAEVLSETEDRECIKVRYLHGEGDSLFAATEDLAHRDEVEALLSVVHRSAWDEKVTSYVITSPRSVFE